LSTNTAVFWVVAPCRLVEVYQRFSLDDGGSKDFFLKFLRRVAGYTLRNEVRNTTTPEELQIFNIGERSQSRKIEWHEHLSRMEQQKRERDRKDSKRVEAKRKCWGEK
jgi:hypothetical protein